MKALIIGASGFVGGYLAEHLSRDLGWSVAFTKLMHESISDTIHAVHDVDILDKSAVRQVLEIERPEYVFHLAAQSSVADSWKNPALTVDVNIKGSLNVLDTVRELESGLRVVLVGSGEEYGHVQPGELPVSENNFIRPGNIYAATKACQNMIGKIYAQAYGLYVIMTRAFNHIGPGQSETFVVSDFCKQVAEIEKGLRPPVINVGNLAARRDFSDVRDVVRAYGILAQRGESGETYNIGSGNAVSIREILDEILSLSSVVITVNEDPAKFRPIDVPLIMANINKLRQDTDWRPTISLGKSLKDTLAFWREKV